jgi:hypothetical protein
MFNILKQRKNMKIIFNTRTEKSTTTFLEERARKTLGEGFITTDKQLTWSDITASSQRAILEKTVIFQGRRFVLKRMISAETINDSFPLADLLHQDEISIGELVSSACSGYNEKYYIDRTFNHNIVIRQDILNNERAEKFDELLASTEQEFKQLSAEFT